jgi:hypothetical protein
LASGSGAQPQPDQKLDGQQLRFFDRLAAVTRHPDKSFAEFRRLYQEDDRVPVSSTIFNVILNRRETAEM